MLSKILNKIKGLTPKQKIYGRIERIEKNQVFGWAYSEKQDQILEVELYLEGRLIDRTFANKFRNELLDSGKHPNGNCGYNFTIFNDYPLDYLKNNLQVLVNGVEPKSPTWQKTTSQGNKILIVGLAKSGTSILTYTVADALKNKKIHFEPDLQDSEYHQKACADPKQNIVTKSLFPWNKSNINLKETEKNYNKKIWIIRDPRDLLISNCFYVWNKSHNPDIKKFEKALITVLKKEQSPKTIPFLDIVKIIFDENRFIPKMYRTTIDTINQLDDSWFILKYEDLMDEKLDELNRYLGFEVNLDSKVPKNLTRVVRSKKYGNWRNWFIKEDVDFFKPQFEKLLKRFKYDTNDWQLEMDQKPKPKEGSEYMASLFYGKDNIFNERVSKYIAFKTELEAQAQIAKTTKPATPPQPVLPPIQAKLKNKNLEKKYFPPPDIKKRKLNEKLTRFSIDRMNGQILAKLKQPIKINNDVINFKGWAIDLPIKSLCEAVYLVIDDKFYLKANYGRLRKDVADSLKLEKLTNCGFDIELNLNDFVSGFHSVGVLLISKDHKNYYHPNKRILIEIP